MHSKLIKMGFIKYHARMVALGKERVFPVIKPDQRGVHVRGAVVVLNDYFAAIGVKVDRTVNFHSFRHNVTDAFRRAGYMDDAFGMLLGHTKATMTGKYGVMPEGILSERVKMIEAINCPILVSGA